MNDIPSLKALNRTTAESEEDTIRENHFKLAVFFVFVAHLSFCCWPLSEATSKELHEPKVCSIPHSYKLMYYLMMYKMEL